MKNLKYFLGALLFSAVTFVACNGNDDPVTPTPDPEPPIKKDMPEVDPVAGKIVVVLNCVDDAVVCSDLVFAGNYNGYNTNPAEMAKFEPIEGWDGWYKTVFEPADPEGVTQGKPCQLAQDGTFPSSWDHQWISQSDADGNVIEGKACEIIKGDAVLTVEYTVESRLDIAAGADVVYVRTHAWKKNPCEKAPTYEITFNVTVPSGLGASDIVYVVGGMNGWTPTATALTKKTGNTWSVVVKEVEFGTEYKYVLNGSWDFEELLAIEDGADCAKGIPSNRKVNDREMNDVVGNFKDVTAEKCQ